MAVIASAAVTLVLTFAAVVAMLVAAKRLRVTITVVVALLLVVAPFGVECLAAVLYHERHLWLDVRLSLIALPGIAAVFAAWAMQRRRPFAGSAHCVAIWAWWPLWGAANTFNACNPGWCRRHGFPFPFYWWSDAIISFDGTMPSPFHPMPLVLDMVVLAVGTYGFARIVR